MEKLFTTQKRTEAIQTNWEENGKASKDAESLINALVSSSSEMNQSTIAPEQKNTFIDAFSRGLSVIRHPDTITDEIKKSLKKHKVKNTINILFIRSCRIVRSDNLSDSQKYTAVIIMYFINEMNKLKIFEE